MNRTANRTQNGNANRSATRVSKLTARALVATLALASVAAFAQVIVPIPPDEQAGSGAAGEVPPQVTIKQESYGIFAIEPSVVAGYLQVIQTQPDSKADFVLTLTNSYPGDLHAAAVYEGDCAPDRPMLLQLARPGESTPEDPFVSITHSDLDYESVVNGDYFVMIFGPELDTTPLACGEVGVGANRSDY